MKLYNELRTKAKKKVLAKKGFYITATAFGAISVILYVVSMNFYGWAAYWIKFPILVLALVLCILYVAIFGFPWMQFNDEDWEEEEIEKEMSRMYRKYRRSLPDDEEMSDEDILELKEFDKLRRKWDDYEGYV